jgi:hypothetical protein
VAGPGGRWRPATIRRINEDGTFKIEFDVKETAFMPFWHGVTLADLSFDDAGQWAEVFAALSPGGQGLDRSRFAGALTRLGFQANAEQAQQFWLHGCQALFGTAAQQAESLVLDQAASYQLFLRLGISARQCAGLLWPGSPPPLFKLYWNQTRMGGRDPGELNRPITLSEALAALSVSENQADPAAQAALEQFERDHGLRLPADLGEFFARSGIAEAVSVCHPNSPSLVAPGDWRLRRDMRSRQLNGEYAIVIMTPHQGSHEWAAVFDDGEADARIYFRWDTPDGEGWLLTAPGLGLFFWDLAQTGLAWLRSNQEKMG